MLQHFVGQDVVGHLELEGAGEELGRLRVAIAFADLAGYTRLTEEAGEEEAVDVVERFVEAVGETLPEEARVVKTIGDEVMVVGADPGTLVDWAVGFQVLNAGVRPAPRIGVHAGETLYRDGDYYGRAVNLAARVGARAAGGEVLVTRPVVEAAGGHLSFEPIGEVKLKGFTEATDLFLARQARPRGRVSVVEERVRAGGLLAGPVVVLLSGGRDSVCLLDLAVRLAGPVTALHVNYGLREEADADEAHCAALAERLGAAFEVRRPGPPRGNVQAWAREVRYRGGGEARPGASPPVTRPPTRSRPCSTGSPPRRAGARCSGSATAPGVIRPLLGCTREETAAHCARARPPLARGPDQRDRRLRAQPGAQRTAARAPRRPPRRPRPTSCARSRSCATRPRCSTR